MDYLQYQNEVISAPDTSKVLNLIINGLPSILSILDRDNVKVIVGFKPYYKWITFNTFKCYLKCLYFIILF